MTVIGGGTIVMPEITYGRAAPSKALLLARAGLDTLDGGGSTVTVGAALPIERLAALAQDVKALAAVRAQRRRLRDPEAGDGRRQSLRGEGHDAPRGDLQGPFLALDAQVRSVGADGEVTEPLEDFLAHRDGRLLLDLRFEKPAASAFAAIDYPHTHEYTVLAVTGVRSRGRRDQARGDGARGPRSAPPVGRGGSRGSGGGGSGAIEDVRLGDDALASAWYRERAAPRARPACPRRARGGSMNLTVNGIAREVESAPLTTLLDVLREELGSRARRRAASRAAAAPAPSSSTASRSGRASRRSERSTAPR